MAQSDMHTGTTLACDVLIAGGGPTGVTLGVLLARRGISVIIAEKEAGVYPLPRAAHLDHEAMRILQDAGVADAVMATCRHAESYDFLTASGEVLLSFLRSAGIDAGGWPSASFIHQPSVEADLRAALADYPLARLYANSTLESFAQSGDGVVGQVTTPAGPVTIEARYLVGADGARSPVRNALGIAFEDLDFDEPWLVVDTIVQDFARLPKVNLQICDPARPTTCVLMGKGRHRWEFMIKPGETPEQVVDDRFIAKLLEPWDVAGAVTLERKAVYRFSARIATDWRQGRVLLAGDAAHQTPPFAGQGMCAGLRDASNLAWKLAAVIQGTATDSLLDSYSQERRPHVRATIDMALMMGKTVCITDPDVAAMRDRQMLAARAAGQSPDGRVQYPEISQGCIWAGSAGAGAYFPQTCAAQDIAIKLDDVLGPQAWLISRSPLAQHRPVENLRVIAADDPLLHPFAGALVDWLKAHDAECVLVRPDHYVFGTGSADALLRTYDETLRASVTV